LCFRHPKKASNSTFLSIHRLPPGWWGIRCGSARSLLNLTGNAVKFTREGEILIDAKLKGVGDRAVIRFSIADTGIGIEPENLDHVFSSFTQADNSTTRQYGGTGLGTTISKQLVELMGGQIRVESQPGNGSTFRFTAEFGIQPDCRPQPAGESVREKRTLSLLVVDNCAATCRILSAYLEQLGGATLTATDGKRCLIAAGRAGRSGTAGRRDHH
jgi:two-component system sensor histidine kinase/response regulator